MWNKWEGIKVSSDLDGILCYDGQPLKPLSLPPYPLVEIITGRHERHRPVTEKWLASNGVEYGRLVMMEKSTMDWMEIAKFKAAAYQSSTASMFVESDSQQAALIGEITNKQVACPVIRLVMP